LKEKHRHFIIHKPFGYLSQFVLHDNTKKRLLGDFFDFPAGTMSIGRLDKHSEGLLLLTTDGKVSFDICGNKVEKEYYVQVDGQITPEVVHQLSQGLEIMVEGQLYMTLPCEVICLTQAPVIGERGKKIRDDRHGPTSWISIVLKEGKNRQIRKMTAKVGYPTLRLVRVRIGSIHLNQLKAGEVIEVDQLVY
jgi:23S rRNA pseudouridine2457 synthase